MGRTWLHGGDEKNAFSLAAYRALRDGEQPMPLLYRNRVIETSALVRRELLIRTWGINPVRLEVTNAGGVGCRFVLRAPSGLLENEVGPGKRLWLEVNLPADSVSPITLDYPKPPEGETVQARLEARLVP